MSTIENPFNIWLQDKTEYITGPAIINETHIIGCSRSSIVKFDGEYSGNTHAEKTFHAEKTISMLLLKKNSTLLLKKDFHAAVTKILQPAAISKNSELLLLVSHKKTSEYCSEMSK